MTTGEFRSVHGLAASRSPSRPRIFRQLLPTSANRSRTCRIKWLTSVIILRGNQLRPMTRTWPSARPLPIFGVQDIQISPHDQWRVTISHGRNPT